MEEEADSITNCFAPKRKELRSEGFLIALYVLAVAQLMNGTDESGSNDVSKWIPSTPPPP
jgi:hypothetical protein